MSRFAAQGTHGLLLQAEVAPSGQAKFEHRYLAATARNLRRERRSIIKLSEQMGANCGYIQRSRDGRLTPASGLPVEYGRQGYWPASIATRVNNNKFCWKLVENHGLRLGPARHFDASFAANATMNMTSIDEVLTAKPKRGCASMLDAQTIRLRFMPG